MSRSISILLTKKQREIRRMRGIRGIDSITRLEREVKELESQIDEMIEGECFIVPNHLKEKKSFMDFQEQFRDDCGFITRHDESYVELWFHNEENENWSDHGFLKGQFTIDYLPVSILKGVEEGDYIYLVFEAMPSKVFKIKCSQIPYRYGRFGRFEDVLDKLLNKAKAA